MNRDFTYIDDVVEAVIKIILSKRRLILIMRYLILVLEKLSL